MDPTTSRMASCRERLSSVMAVSERRRYFLPPRTDAECMARAEGPRCGKRLVSPRNRVAAGWRSLGGPSRGAPRVSLLSETRDGERVARSREEIALHEIAAGALDFVAFGFRFDAFGDDAHAELLAHGRHRPDERLLGRVAVDITRERHVELHEFGLEQGEAREPGVTGAEVVECDAVAEPAELDEAFANIPDW